MRLRIEHERLLEAESAESVQDTVAYLRQDGVQALKERHGVAVVEGAEVPEIIVTLHWVRHDDSVYGVSVKTRRPGEQAREVEAFECECIDSGLSKAVLERVPAALGQLGELEPEPAGVEPVEPEPPEPEVGDPRGSEPEEDLGPRRATPLEAMGKAGIGLLSLGAAGVITGGVVLAQGKRVVDEDDGLLDRQVRDFRPVGVGVMVASGAFAVTGLVLLVVDRVRARRSRDVASLSAWLVPIPKGLAVAVRF